MIACLVMGIALGLVFGLFCMERANSAVDGMIKSLGHTPVRGGRGLSGFVMSSPIRREDIMYPRGKAKPYANY